MARLNTGGPSRHVILLDAGLRSRGHQTLLVHGAVSATESSMEPLADAQQIPRLKLPYLGRSLRVVDDVRAFLRVTQLLYRERPDVVHTHTSKAGMVGRAAAAVYNRLTPGRRRCVVIHTFHGHVFEGYFSPLVTRVVLAIERTLGRVTDRVVTLSPRQRHDIVVRYGIAPASKVVTIPLGLDLEPLLDLAPGDADLRGRLDIPPDAVVIGFVGRLVPIKDAETLLRAFAQAHHQQPNLHLLVAGDGQMREPLLARARELGVAGRVHAIGWWNGPLTELYQTLDVCALSSLNEGTPVTLIEAMAAGVAVVATAVGGVPDVVEDGVAGLLVPPRDVGRMTAALLALTSDPSRRAAMGAAGRRHVAGRFMHGRLVDDIERLYRDVARSGRA